MVARFQLLSTPILAAGLFAVTGVSAAATTIQVGDSGKTFASLAPECRAEPLSGQSRPAIDAGLFNPTPGRYATVTLGGQALGRVDAYTPALGVFLADGHNEVGVALTQKKVDRYTFDVVPGLCQPPDTSGNTFSPDGTLEYAASGKSYLTVTPGCALNPLTGLAQPWVRLFDNGSFLLNVSVNGRPLTQLDGRTLTHVVVFLSAGTNVITAANAAISTDTYVRDGGAGTCSLP